MKVKTPSILSRRRLTALQDEQSSARPGSVAAATLRVKTGLQRRGDNKPRVLVLPPSSPGSLGDEAVIGSLVHALGDQAVGTIDVATYLARDEWDRLIEVRRAVPMERYFGRHYFRDQVDALRVLSRYSHLVVLGTDVLDGAYNEARTLRRLALPSLAAEAGLTTSVVNFSLNREPTESALAAWRRLPSTVQLCARDPVSRDRVRQLLGPRRVELGADIAFVLPSVESEHIAPVRRWLERQKKEGHTVVGININPQVISREHLDPLLESYSRTIGALASHGVSFVLLPHDFRGEINDASLSLQLLRMLPSALRTRSMMMPAPYSASEVKAVCGNLDAAVVGRMHCAIACLGQGVPVGAVTYQDKFEGLFGHFELQGMTVSPDVATLRTQLPELAVSILDRRETLRRRIRAKLPAVQDLARVNLTCALHDQQVPREGLPRRGDR